MEKPHSTGLDWFCAVLFTIQNVQNWNWGYGQSYKTGTAVPVLNRFGSVQFRFFFSFEYQTCKHYFHYAMKFFGSPNGLCSSITESKHIKAVKEPWHRSSQFEALIQMLQTITQMDKMV
jgi:hypothetical protein